MNVTLPKIRTVKKAKFFKFNSQNMKKSIISEAKIIKSPKEYEGGRDHAQIGRELGIHKSTFYNWRKKYAGMDSQELKRLKELEEENYRLKHMYAELALDSKMLKDVLEKKL